MLAEVERGGGGGGRGAVIGGGSRGGGGRGHAIGGGMFFVGEKKELKLYKDTLALAFEGKKRKIHWLYTGNML